MFSGGKDIVRVQLGAYSRSLLQEIRFLKWKAREPPFGTVLRTYSGQAVDTDKHGLPAGRTMQTLSGERVYQRVQETWLSDVR